MASGIDYFYRNHWASSFQARVSLWARSEMYRRWLQKSGPITGMSVLDVGATPDCERIDSNCMLPWISRDGGKLTISSPEDISKLKSAYPGAQILSGKHAKLECIPSKSYDWVVSSAVLEHVGSTESQKIFIADCIRIAKKGVFFTTPNRWHWLEFHTKIPFLHWFPKTWHRVVLGWLGLRFWSSEANLNLLTRSEVRSILSAHRSTCEVSVDTIWFLGMPSNIYGIVLCKN